ncbi:MAG: YicC family protein [Firmicutes bacterium]|nr:YicC family protein [Bacillota bacterium]
MKSMTGYGKYILEDGSGTVTAQVKSVNGRFLDVNMRVPKVLGNMDDVIRRAVSATVKRGTVDVSINYCEAAAGTKALKINLPLARAYAQAAASLKNELNIADDLGAAALLRLPEIAEAESAEFDPAAAAAMVSEAVTKAVEALDGMRVTEGQAIAADIESILARMDIARCAIQADAPRVLEENSKKIRERIKELLSGAPIDENRMLNEAAVFADKSDVNEELNRLDSHLRQFRAAMNDDQAGRKLDFLSQELLREANTIGSKCSDAGLTNHVLALKNEIEKLKEQIRNIE